MESNNIYEMIRNSLETTEKLKGTITVQDAMNVVYQAIDLVTCQISEPLRNQAAIAAMQGMLSNTDTINQYANDEAYKSLGSITDVVAKASVMYADALIKELKHPQQ